MESASRRSILALGSASAHAAEIPFRAATLCGDLAHFPGGDDRCSDDVCGQSAAAKGLCPAADGEEAPVSSADALLCDPVLCHRVFRRAGFRRPGRIPLCAVLEKY